MHVATKYEPLTRAGTRVRAFALLALVAALGTLRLVEPTSFGGVWPFATSCGAVTGLPCIFCGMTRAIHHLLSGEFSRARYFNWLAFPFLAACIVVFAIAAAELVGERRLVVYHTTFRFTPRTAACLFAALVALWSLQVYLAVAGGKAELLNPRGPLYSLLVR